MSEHIAPGQTLEECAEFLPRVRCCTAAKQRQDTFKELRVMRLRMDALFIETSAHVVRRGDIKLPQRFRLPGRKRFGVDGANVGVRKKAQQFQALRRADVFRESTNGIG